MQSLGGGPETILGCLASEEEKPDFFRNGGLSWNLELLYKKWNSLFSLLKKLFMYILWTIGCEYQEN